MRRTPNVSFMIDKRSKTVYISGKFNPQIVVEKITKAGNNAVIVWSKCEPDKQPENRKDRYMEQCYAPRGYMNPSLGYSNYPPPGYWMNQPQPYIHNFAPPPPYVQQFHPQPPAPPPYEFHQSEPVPKSFPPTPPPPKNFTMGDLQPFGCIVM
ncbi:hypothetical protein CARUB_v10012053mg [Capsella rubella]|uniref:HMA domain-containing protein n=1 Tax=Capsella rubella TaxID=81985 RepID=R0GTK7_9BRAS|nr:hypothetical protein CARUB_v10012053mg [Capsella rubella]